MGNHRLERINEEYKKALSTIIADEVRDPRITAMVSVTGADVTNDLKQCKVYLSIYGTSKEEEDETFAAINNARGFIRTRLSRTVNLRNTPELKFIRDTSIDYGMKMDELIKKISGEEGSGEERED